MWNTARAKVARRARVHSIDIDTAVVLLRGCGQAGREARTATSLLTSASSTGKRGKNCALYFAEHSRSSFGLHMRCTHPPVAATPGARPSRCRIATSSNRHRPAIVPIPRNVPVGVTAIQNEISIYRPATRPRVGYEWNSPTRCRMKTVGDATRTGPRRGPRRQGRAKNWVELPMRGSRGKP